MGSRRNLKESSPARAVVLGLALALGAALLLPATALATARPAVTSVSPRQGGVAGGTVVTVTGKHFTASGKSVVRAVKFGKVLGTRIHVRSSTLLTVRAPRRAKGTVNVFVVTPGGTSAAVRADRFVYKAGPGPLVTGIGPAYGPTAGGTAVTITGSGFTGATAVKFGGAAAKFTVTSDTAIAATTPKGSAANDPYDVRVTTPHGTGVMADAFNYYAPPLITSVSPGNGPLAGGTSVTITGNFLFTAKLLPGAVTFGGVAAGYTVKSNTTIVATAPAGAGTVDVAVATFGGTTATSAADQYSYAAHLSANSVTSQSATAGSPVGTPPSVLVTDGQGDPVQGVSVTFAVASGGGTIAGGTATTDITGIATAASWTLGDTDGPNTVTATSAGLSGSPLTFHATGVSGTADQIAALAGNGQTADAGTAVAVDPSVVVTDSHGNPVSGTAITFAAASGGGSVTGGSAVTNASGVATVGSWTLGDTAGSNTLTATNAGLSGSPVTFTATGRIGAAAVIAQNGGEGQTAAAGTAVTTPPSVVVTDAHGNPVSGVGVTFAVGSGGGSVGGASVTTDASGVATVGNWTLGDNPGANTLTATHAGLDGSPVTFHATGITGAAATIAINGGDGQTTDAGTAVAVDPSVLVTDGHGNPVSGVSVTFAVDSGGGSVSGGSAVTDGSGIAAVGSWTLGDLAGANTLTATHAGLDGSPVTFHATGVTGAAATIAINGGDGQTADAGTAVAVDPSVLITDAHGNPVSGVSVTFAVESGGGSVGGGSAVTDGSGIAAAASWTLGDPGENTLSATSDGLSGSPVTFHATGVTGAAAVIAVNDGDGQTAAAGTAVATAPSVLVTDAHGDPVAGVSVTFAVESGGGSVDGGSALTDASGIAAVTSWTLGDPGENTLSATSDGLSGSPLTFSATGV